MPATLFLLLAGCSSLDLQTAVLVKVPSKEIVQTPKRSSKGWHFRHVLQAPLDDQRRGQWYVAWHKEKPLRTSFLFPYWRSLLSRTPEIADAARESLHAYPILIEPNRSFANPGAKPLGQPKVGKPLASEKGDASQTVELSVGPMKVWPDAIRRENGQRVLDPRWHQGERYTQLKGARGQFVRPGEGIKVGHLDNGLDGNHPAVPRNLVRGQKYANAVGLLNWLIAPEKHPLPMPPEAMGATHGLGTSSIGFGNKVKVAPKKVGGVLVEGFDDYLGGAPFATVVPVRVAPAVFSISTGELAYGIDYASRQQHCDVITMSHGGSPTQAWVDAVNAAYERGTAMFAAESNFFSVMTDPSRPRGIILPTSPVYPAAFRRVVGVTGVTAGGGSYARNNWLRILRAPWQLPQWIMRGSYGADGTSTALITPNREPDTSQVRRQGALRPHPIAAYSPNIAWASVRKVKGKRVADGLDLDGGGTSSATPQVAAAAALWLQKNRHQIPDEVWNGEKDGWKKAEAVYYALLKSADRGRQSGPDRYLGAGKLKAEKALEISYRQAFQAQKPKDWPDLQDPPKDSLYCEKTGNDYFDGGRSIWRFLGVRFSKNVPFENRAGLRQRPGPNEDREAALTRLYYNVMLLREWHGGNIPDNHKHDRMYWERARKRAAKAPAPMLAFQEGGTR